jgi:hypothetical protein
MAVDTKGVIGVYLSLQITRIEVALFDPGPLPKEPPVRSTQVVSQGLLLLGRSSQGARLSLQGAVPEVKLALVSESKKWNAML